MTETSHHHANPAFVHRQVVDVVEQIPAPVATEEPELTLVDEMPETVFPATPGTANVALDTEGDEEDDEPQEETLFEDE